MKLTLVAHYGEKPDPLATFVEEAQALLASTFGGAFLPYRLEQVHGTIVGLEGRRHGEGLLQQSHCECFGVSTAVNVPRLFELLHSTEHLPFTIQLGGFAAERDYGFLSRGRPPSARSFSVQTDIAVAMGWPVRDGAYPLTLDSLRRTFNGANVRHKYHRAPADIDNDFFFVLGRIDGQRCSADSVGAAQEAIRSVFQHRPATRVHVDRSSLRFVLYQDAALPWGQCPAFTVAEAERHWPLILRACDEVAE